MCDPSRLLCVVHTLLCVLKGEALLTFALYQLPCLPKHTDFTIDHFDCPTKCLTFSALLLLSHRSAIQKEACNCLIQPATPVPDTAVQTNGCLRKHLWCDAVPGAWIQTNFLVCCN